METIGKYKVHPLAAKLPLMSNEEFIKLKESIRTQGLLHPVIISDIDPLEIIDGRNRVMACNELEITPRFISLYEYLNESAERRELTWMTDELSGLRKAESTGDYNAIIESFIILQNINRRQLPDWQKYLTLIAVKGKPKKGGDRPSKKDKNFEKDNLAVSKTEPSVPEIAETIGVSEKTVQRMNVINDKAPEEIKEQLASGKISVNKAYEEAKKDPMKEPKKEEKQKPKKQDWFEENIEDENERFIWKLLVEITRKIETKVGLVYISEFKNLINDNINHQNYIIKWKERQG